jgi:Tfp pilus assembly protein PilN
MKICSIYITNNFIRFGQAASDKEKQSAAFKQQIDISSLKEEGILASLKTFLKQNKIVPDYLVLGIPRTQVSIKFSTLPVSDDHEVEQMVGYKLNSLFPYRQEKLIFDHAVTHKDANGYSEVMLIAVQKEAIVKQILLLKKAGLIPDTIDLSTVSLCNQFFKLERPSANYLLVHCDDNFVELIHISGQRVNFSRGVTFSYQEGNEDLIKTIDFTATTLKDKGSPIDQIILCGEGLNLESFALKLKEKSGYKVQIDNTLGVMNGFLGKNNEEALKINLLPKEFKINKAKWEKRRAIFYFAALALLNLSLAANLIFLKMRGKEEYLQALNAEIKKIETQASTLQEKMVKTQIIRDHLNSGRLKLALLSRLYQLAPEGLHLTSLDISGQKSNGTMILTGKALDSGTVLKFGNALKNSALITKTDVTYITKEKTAAEQMVDFEIRANF